MDAVGHAADVGQKEVECLGLAVGSAPREEGAGALDEVVGVAARGAKRGHVGLDALFADKSVGVEAAFERDDLDLEAFFGEQRDGLFGGGGSGLVGVEVDDNTFSEATKQADLHLGKGGAGGGEDVFDAGRVDGDAVHLALDQEGEVVGAHVCLGFVEVEEDVALGCRARFRGSSGNLAMGRFLSSTSSSARAVNAMVLPCSLAMGKAMRRRKRA